MSLSPTLALAHQEYDRLQRVDRAAQGHAVVPRWMRNRVPGRQGSASPPAPAARWLPRRWHPANQRHGLRRPLPPRRRYSYPPWPQSPLYFNQGPLQPSPAGQCICIVYQAPCQQEKALPEPPPEEQNEQAESVVSPVARSTVQAPLDGDEDGIPDAVDLCPGTAGGGAADALGCDPDGPVVLQHAGFNPNSARLTDEARGTLERVAAVLKAHPDQKLEVSAYIEGADASHKTLADSRAIAVMVYLVEKGVPPGMLIARGYNENNTLNDGEPPADNLPDSRIELKRIR